MFLLCPAPKSNIVRAHLPQHVVHLARHRVKLPKSLPGLGRDVRTLPPRLTTQVPNTELVQCRQVPDARSQVQEAHRNHPQRNHPISRGQRGFTPHVSATGRQCPPPLILRALTGCTWSVLAFSCTSLYPVAQRLGGRCSDGLDIVYAVFPHLGSFLGHVSRLRITSPWT